MQLRLSTLLVAAAVFGAVAAVPTTSDEAIEKRLIRGTGPGRNFAFKEAEPVEKRLIRGVGPGRNTAFKEEQPVERADAPIANDLGYLGGAGSRAGYAWKRDEAPIANDLGYLGGAGSNGRNFGWKRSHEAKREVKEAKA